MVHMVHFSRSFSCVLAAAFCGGCGSGDYACIQCLCSKSLCQTEEEWAKLRDNVIEYDELEGLIHEYNATVQNNQYTYQKFRQTMGIPMRKWAQEYYKLAQDYYNDMSGDDDASSCMSDLNFFYRSRETICKSREMKLWRTVGFILLPMSRQKRTWLLRPSQI